MESGATPNEWANGFRSLNRPLFITIDGGEPFLKPDFVRTVELLQQSFFLGLATSLTVDVAEFLDVANFDRIPRMLLSYHPTQIESIELFISRVKSLIRQGLKAYILNIVAYPSIIADLENFRKRFQEAGLKIHVTRFVGQYQDKYYPDDYSKEELDIILPMMTNPISRMQVDNPFKPMGKRCGAGRQFIWVAANGNVSRCCHHSDKSMGNILRHGVQLNDHNLPCDAEQCTSFQPIERGITPFVSRSEAERHAKEFYTNL